MLIAPLVSISTEYFLLPISINADLVPSAFSLTSCKLPIISPFLFIILLLASTQTLEALFIEFLIISSLICISFAILPTLLAISLEYPPTVPFIVLNTPITSLVFLSTSTYISVVFPVTVFSILYQPLSVIVLIPAYCSSKFLSIFCFFISWFVNSSPLNLFIFSINEE